MNASEIIRFGRFVLNRSRGCLEDQQGAERSLRPKSYRVLQVLCERRGELLSKDELVREVWPEVIVSDDSLAHCISDIRRALGSDGARLLRTVPRRGYMLVAEESASKAPSEPDGKRQVATAAGVAAALLVAAAGAWWAAASRSRSRARPGSDGRDASGYAARCAGLAATGGQRAGPAPPRDGARRLPRQCRCVRQPRADLLAGSPAPRLGGGRREMAQALEMAERALVLGGSARSHRLLAEMRLLAPFRDMRSPVDALANARAAVTIDPADPDNLAVLAHVLALTGRADEAVRTIEEAMRRDTTPPDWYRHVAGLSYLLAEQPARAADEFGTLYRAGTFASARWWPGWLYAASLAHAGRTGEAVTVIRAANGIRPEESITAVAQSFDGFADPADLAVVLEGLRLAGMPG